MSVDRLVLEKNMFCITFDNKKGYILGIIAAKNKYFSTVDELLTALNETQELADMVKKAMETNSKKESLKVNIEV